MSIKQLKDRLSDLKSSFYDIITDLEGEQEDSIGAHAEWETARASFELEEIYGVETEFDEPEPELIDHSASVAALEAALKLIYSAMDKLDEAMK